jgi:hypothetical protein
LTTPIDKPRSLANFYRMVRLTLGDDAISSSLGVEKSQFYNYENHNEPDGGDIATIKRYAQLAGVPVGIALLLTRSASKYRERDMDDLSQLAKGMRDVARELDVLSNELAAGGRHARSDEQVIQLLHNSYSASGRRDPADNDLIFGTKALTRRKTALKTKVSKV